MKDSKPAKTSDAKKKKKGGHGRPFKKNDPATGFIDARINRSGQNRGFSQVKTEVRELAQIILAERVDDIHNKKTVTMSRLEKLFRDWLASNDVAKQREVVQYGVGKVADEVIVNSEIENFISSNLDLLTDGQVERLRKGESGLGILGELLKDAAKIVKENKAKQK